MQKKKSKQDLLKKLEECLSRDKRKTEVLGLTRLGLVEIARRREKDSIDSYYLRSCEACGSDFGQKSINYILDDLEKEVMRIKEHTDYNNILMELKPFIYNEMLDKYSNALKKIENKYGVNIEITKTTDVNQKDEKIIYK